jgi:hypothetical protein
VGPRAVLDAVVKRCTWKVNVHRPIPFHFGCFSSVPTARVAGLVSLRTLDLSHNLLEKLDNKTHGLLDDCLSLERVRRSKLGYRAIV